MRTVVEIARNDLRILLSNRSIWINLLFVPLVLAYAVGLANGAGGGTSSAPSLIVDVIAQDQGALVDQFLADVRAANPSLVLCPLDNHADDLCDLRGAALDEPLATERLQNETSLALIEIPANFSADLSAGKGVHITYRSNESASAPSYILQAVQAAAQKLGAVEIAAQVGANVADGLHALTGDADRAAFEDAVRQNASQLWAQNPVTVNYVVAQQPASASSSGSGGFSQSIPGIGTMYVLFTLLPTAASIVLQRKTGILPRLSVMPISRAQILGGKLLANFLIGMLEYAIMFGFGLLLGVHYGSDPLAIVVLMIAFTLCVTSLTLALTSLLHNEAQARGIGLLLTLTLCPLGGAWWPLDIVPQWMRTVGHVSPVAWVMDGFNALIFQSGGLSTVIVPILVLLGMALVFFAYGLARFKFTD